MSSIPNSKTPGSEARRAAGGVDQSPSGTETEKQADGEELDIIQEASQCSFPASDPPPWTLGRDE